MNEMLCFETNQNEFGEQNYMKVRTNVLIMLR